MSDAAGGRRVVVAVPCRLKSSRLPRKAERPLNGVPSIERCLLQCAAARTVDDVVLVTSDLPEDEPLAAHAREVGADVVHGDPLDVLQRMLAAADRLEPDVMLRVTGDCPVVSHELIDLLVERHLEDGADMTIAREGTVPVGASADVYDADALRRLRALFPETEYSEYLSRYFKNNTARFRVLRVDPPERYRRPEWRLTLDEPDDLDVLETVLAEIGAERRAVDFDEVAAVLKARPDLVRRNATATTRTEADAELNARLDAATTLPPPDDDERA